jgi:hypothetical protein
MMGYVNLLPERVEPAILACPSSGQFMCSCDRADEVFTTPYEVSD